VRRPPCDNICAASVDKNFPLIFIVLICVSVDTLGYFSLFTNLSYALCLPFWGWLVHRYTVQNAHNILCLSCALWGAATLFIARSETVLAQAFFRSLNGGALASILPLSQMMLVDLVPSSMRGSAFGLMGFLEKTAATLATSAVIWFSPNWRIPYYVVGSISVLMAFSAKRYLRMKTKIKKDEASTGDEPSLLGIFRRISQIPAFVYLVAQGVFGAIPWDMMSFVLLLLEWKNFTKKQIISFSVAGGIFGTVGAFLGGVLGDIFAHLPDGRVNVALVSVLLGILFYGLFLYSETYRFCIFFHSMFHLTGGWCPAAALRSVSRDYFWRVLTLEL
jgi:MFS family permease